MTVLKVDFFAAALLVHVYAVTTPEVASVTFAETDHPTPRTTPNTLAAFSIINPVAVLFFPPAPNSSASRGLCYVRKLTPPMSPKSNLSPKNKRKEKPPFLEKNKRHFSWNWRTTRDRSATGSSIGFFLPKASKKLFVNLVNQSF